MADRRSFVTIYRPLHSPDKRFEHFSETRHDYGDGIRMHRTFYNAFGAHRDFRHHVVGAALTPAKIAQGISFHVVAFLVVGLLAARLADRRTSGDQLKEATKNLASLRALHERIIEIYTLRADNNRSGRQHLYI